MKWWPDEFWDGLERKKYKIVMFNGWFIVSRVILMFIVIVIATANKFTASILVFMVFTIQLIINALGIFESKFDTAAILLTDFGQVFVALALVFE